MITDKVLEAIITITKEKTDNHIEPNFATAVEVNKLTKISTQKVYVAFGKLQCEGKVQVGDTINDQYAMILSIN